MRTTLAGPSGTAAAGDVLDLPEAAAYDLIERGYAVQLGAVQVGAVHVGAAPASDPAPAEQATASAPETAEAPPRRGRRGAAAP